MRKALLITTVSTILLVIAAQLVLAFCCRLPIASKDLSEYTFKDPLPLENYPDFRLSILTTATITAPEGAVFEGGSWFNSRRLGMTAVLLCHPERFIIFDTGLGRKIDTQFKDMPAPLKWILAYEDLNPLADQLDADAFCPDREPEIIVSHLHWDHAGGIEDFPDALVWLPQSELVSARKLNSEGGYLGAQFDDPTINWRFLEWRDVPYANYSQSLDLTGDGSIVLVPMVGHTEGSVGMFVHLGPHQRYFFTGDITWSKEGFTKPAHRHFLMRSVIDGDIDGVQAEILRVHALMQHDPLLHVVPAHDSNIEIKSTISE